MDAPVPRFDRSRSIAPGRPTLPTTAGLALALFVVCVAVFATAPVAGASDSASPSPVEEFEVASSQVDAIAAASLPIQQQSDATANASVTRNGSTLVLGVPADRIGDANATTLAVTVPAANGSTSAEARRTDDRYVARVPVTDVVGPNVTADLAEARVVASSAGTVVLEDTADLRYVAGTGPATFLGARLAIPADVRGLGSATPELASIGSDGRFGTDGDPSEPGVDRFETAIDGTGPNATLLVAPGALANVSTNRTVATSAVVGNATVSPAPIQFHLADAAARATAMVYRDGDPVVLQPLAHPAIGPERVDLTVATNGPNGQYATRTATEEAAVPVPPSVVGANGIRVRVRDLGGSTLLDVPVAAPGRATVPLRIANRSLYAPTPAALAGYDTLLLRHDGNVSSVPVDAALRRGEPRALTGPIAEPGQDATALLVGEGVRPARVDLTVVPPPAPDPDPDPDNPNEDAFVGLWLDVGSIVGLLLVAMVGSVLSVGFVYSLRRLSPARSAEAGGRAILGHFLLGGIGGAACIAIVQSLYWGSVLGTVTLAGTAVGLGAVLVGTFHGGLTATGLRLGLGTLDAWPTRRVVDETAVPVRVRFTDDQGETLPGEQSVEVRRAADGTVVETASLAGTTTEVELPTGEYAIQGRTAERESDGVDLVIEEPTMPRPETRSVHLTVGRPGLQIEATDVQTGDAVPTGQVTVTTDRDRTKQVAVNEGTATTTLPIATGTATVVASAPGYDDESTEVPIEEALTTVDVALDPASGTLVVSAIVAGEAIPDATVSVEPAENPVEGGDVEPVGAGTDSGGAGTTEGTDASGDNGTSSTDAGAELAPDVGVRTAEETTDEEGRATFDLPVGAYRASLTLDGPNAGLFAIADAEATVESDAESSVSVHARFDWEPDEGVRRRAAGLRKTIQSVGEEATADPTIPLYFAGATEALLDCVEALPASGQHFATSAQDPDRVATAAVAAAEAALEAVGQAMQAEGVRPVIASRSEPVRVSPDIDASPADLLAYLEQDLTIASVESRAHEVEDVVDRESDRVRSVAPPRAVLRKAVTLVPDDGSGADADANAAAREFAALLLLDAVEQCFARSEIRSRLDGAA